VVAELLVGLTTPAANVANCSDILHVLLPTCIPANSSYRIKVDPKHLPMEAQSGPEHLPMQPEHLFTNQRGNHNISPRTTQPIIC